MPQIQQAEIDPSEAMSFLESSDAPEPTGAGTDTNASTTKDERSSAATNSEHAQANAGSPETHAKEVRSEDTNSQSSQTQNSQNQNPGSLFDAAAQRSSARTFEPADSDLIMLDGQLVPFKQVRESAVFKPRYDAVVRDRDELRSEIGGVREEKKKVDAVKPFIDTLEKDIYGRTYVEILTLTGDAERARRAAEAAAGITPVGTSGTQQASDPRLTPPKDETGEPLPKDHPDYLAWLTGPYAQANAEIGTRKVLAEAEAKAEAKARTEREASDARARTSNEQAANLQRIDRHNMTQLNQLDPELRKRGIAVEKLTTPEWNRAREIVANAVKKHGIDLYDDSALRQKPLMEGFMGLVLNDESVVTQIRGINPAAVNDRGPERAPETQTAATGANGQQVNGQQNGQLNGQQQNQGRHALRNSFSRQPLNAGPPSESIAGRGPNSNMDDRSSEDQTADAMNSLL